MVSKCVHERVEALRQIELIIIHSTQPLVCVEFIGLYTNFSIAYKRYLSV